MKLYASTPLENATVTGDALNNNKAQAQAVLDAGGDYFFQLKKENRHAYKAASRKTEAPPFFSYTEEPDANHGRIDQRQISVYPFEPVEAKLPGARALVVIKRTSVTGGEEKNTTAFYITNHTPTPDCARTFGNLARGHWGGCESRNHWVRDACMREDKTRCKNYRINCNLSALRVCLVALKAELHPQPSWPELQECCQHNPEIPYRTLVKHRAK